MNDLKDAPLGKETSYKQQYDAKLLFPILRQEQRQGLGIGETLPFIGNDLWYAYELSWLDKQGKPQVAVGQFLVPCDSPYLVESKSLKLYLNSFNGTKFASVSNVLQTMIRDLSAATGAEVDVQIQLLSDLKTPGELIHFDGICLDDLPVACDTYHLKPDFLTFASEKVVTETLYSNLLRSHCRKTGQPDWGSVQITYTGREIDKTGLLRYIVSFRNHQGFSEDCAEQIFTDIMQRCAPEELTVEARYTRRGGLDINPIRTNGKTIPQRLAGRFWRH